MKDPVYIISDAHLGMQYSERKIHEKKLISFFRSLHGSNATLIINGDLFDFWIEYSQVIRSDYFIVLHELRLLQESGVEIHYCAGNHDFALGKFLSETIGITLHLSNFTFTAQNKNVYICHGDGILPHQQFSRFLSKILRNKINQSLYRMLHPDLGISLGSWISLRSRHATYNTYSQHHKLQYLTEAKHILQKGYDIVVLSHTHSPELYQIQDKYYCNTGDWIHHDTFVKLAGGTIQLLHYNHNEKTQPFSL